jgi:hypothetical protein
MTLRIMMMILSLTILPNIALANTSTNPTEMTASNGTGEVPAEVQAMYDRLDEIKAMDKSEMSSSEKKALRKEVRSIKSELKATGNGIYLSIGAIIIIILLLILLL